MQIMSYLKTMSIKNKIRMLSFFPLLFLVCLSIYIDVGIYKKVAALENIREIVNLNTKISLLLHETQKERGASAGYLGSKGLKFKDTLANQKELTNKNIEEFNRTLKAIDSSNYPQNSKALIAKALEDLSSIETIRSEVSDLKIEAKKAIEYYTNLNSTLLSFVALTSTIAHSEKDIKNITAYYNFLMAKERAGVERAVGSNTFAAKAFASGMYEKYLGLVNEQKIFFDTFFLYSEEDNRTFFNEKIQHPVINEVQKMRQILLVYGEDRTVALDIDSTLWFNKITEKINVLKEIDDHLSDNLIIVVDEEIKKEKNLMYILLSLSMIIITLTIYFVIFFNNSISRGIDKIYVGIEQFMRYLNREINELGYIELNTKGELGNLSKMVNQNIDKINGDLEKDLLCVGEASITLDKFE